MLQDTKTMEEYFTPAEIGEFIRKLRELCGIKQASLASDAAMTERTLSRVENGEKASAETLRRLAAALKLPADFFLIPHRKLDEAEIKGTHEKLVKENFVVDVKRPAASDLVNELRTTECCFHEAAPTLTEKQREMAAVLFSLLDDWSMIISDIGAKEQYDAGKGMMDCVADLEKEGAWVYTGIQPVRLTTSHGQADGTQKKTGMDWRAHVVCVVPKGVELEKVLIPKKDTSFSL